MSTRLITTSSRQTQRFGEKTAKDALKAEKSRERAMVLGLVGELGGGKTTFLQGFAKGLGIKEKILSPTFIIVRRIKNFYHIDCYRLKNHKELLDLGFKKIISDPENIVAVEWADKVKKIMPRETVWLNFKFINGKTRQITAHRLRSRKYRGSIYL